MTIGRMAPCRKPMPISSCSRITALHRFPGATSSGSCPTISSSSSYHTRKVAAATVRCWSVMRAAAGHRIWRRRAKRQEPTSGELPDRPSRLLIGAADLGLLVLALDTGQPLDQTNLLLSQHVRGIARFLPLSLL